MCGRYHGWLPVMYVSRLPILLSYRMRFPGQTTSTWMHPLPGLEGWFRLDSPATPERIRMACCDELSGPFAGPDFQALASC